MSDSTKGWRGCGKMGNSHTWLMEVKTGPTTVENNLAILVKLKMHTAHNPVIPLPGIYAKSTAHLQKQIAIRMFTSALTVITKNWKQPTSPTIGEWINSCGIFIQ